MERLNSSQQSQSVSGLEEQKTPVLKQEVIPITSTDSKSDTIKPVSLSKHHLQRKVVLGVLLGAGTIISCIYSYQWWQYNHQHTLKFQETDNAYVTANIQPVTSRISGIVTEVAVNDNQMVSLSDTLVKLDERDLQVALTQAKASLELAKQQAASIQENIKDSKINPVLLKPDTVNKNTQIKQIGNTEKILQAQTINRQTKINQQKYTTALAVIAQKQAEVNKAELQLSYTNITAQVAGKIGNKNVSVGQLVQPGQTLLTVVQPSPWIVANFKETQLEKIQPGQKVTIKIAAFPSRKFQGLVESLSPTSFGKVAVVPQDNVTGNSVKSQDGQRIPVKIVFESKSLQGYESRMTPGMSATAVVETK